jgi:Fe-S-cluster-containing hydrogenase component 2
MRRIRPGGDLAPPLSTPSPSPGDRSPLTLGVVGAACLRCPDEPCVRFDEDESGGGLAAEVCPTRSIHRPRSESGPTVDATCIGCGLCAMRCPIGAISIEGVACVEPPNLKRDHPASNDKGFFGARADQSAETNWSDAEFEAVAERLAGAGASLLQGSFYPLVASLFTAAGHPAWRPPAGDTSNRIDVILIDDEDSLPVEVKSRTESPVINVKAVQQALENRVVLDERQLLPARRDSSTLAVGFDYPPIRSDVTELVNDVARAYDIRVGLISLSVLYRLTLRVQLLDVEMPRDALSTLQGQLP